MWWLLPQAALLLAFYAYPVLDVFRLSFTNANLLAPGYRYGLGAYAAVLGQPEFAATLRVTGIFVAASVIAQLALGFAIALLIHAGTRAGVAGTVATRTVVLTAWAIPGVLIGVVWRILLSEGSYGIVNYALSRAGVGPVRFLSDPSLALLSIIVANVWRGTAFSMILQYAGLQTIAPELYEAAAVDGAGPARQLTHITLPAMRPILFINLVLITVATLNTFDMVLALTGGGPGRSTEVVALAVYTTIFHEFSLGRGAALAVILLLINLAFVAAYSRLSPAAVDADT
jgi:multiple sugar transport system permease protein